MTARGADDAVMNNFIIRPYRSLRLRVLLLLLLILLPPLALLMYLEEVDINWNLNLLWGQGEEASADELLDENVQLNERLVILEQNNQVDKQALALLQQQLLAAQEENFRLRKDLEFYQGIMDVKDDKNSPIVHGLRIKSLAQHNAYRMELILLHITNRDELFEGVLDITVAGIQDGAAKRLPLRGLSHDRNKDYAIRFRNFQRFEQNFILPDKFEAQTIVVTVSISGQDKGKLEREFDWPVTADGETENVG